MAEREKLTIPPSEMWAMRFIAWVDTVEKLAKDPAMIGSCDMRIGGKVYGAEFFDSPLYMMYRGLKSDRPVTLVSLPDAGGPTRIVADHEGDDFISRYSRGSRAAIEIPQEPGSDYHARALRYVERAIGSSLSEYEEWF